MAKRYIIAILMAIALLVAMAVPCFAYGLGVPEGSGDYVKYSSVPLNITYTYNDEYNANGYNEVVYTDTIPLRASTDAEITAYTYLATELLNEQAEPTGLLLRPSSSIQMRGVASRVMIETGSFVCYSSRLPDFRYSTSSTLDDDVWYFNVDYEVFSQDGRFLDRVKYNVSGRALNSNYYPAFKPMPTGAYKVVVNNIQLYKFDYNPYLASDYVAVGYMDERVWYPIDTDDIIIADTFDGVPVGEFLWKSVSNFLTFEIIEGVSLYMVLLAVIALPLILWFLKLVAGG